MKWGLKTGTLDFSRFQPAPFRSPVASAQGGLRRQRFHRNRYITPIDCAVCKEAVVALSGVSLVEVPERGDTLRRLLARTAADSRTNTHAGSPGRDRRYSATRTSDRRACPCSELAWAGRAQTPHVWPWAYCAGDWPIGQGAGGRVAVQVGNSALGHACMDLGAISVGGCRNASLRNPYESTIDARRVLPYNRSRWADRPGHRKGVPYRSHPMPAWHTLLTGGQT
jgi:hypothetical protein